MTFSHLHSLTNVLTKCQLHTQDFKVQGHYSKVKCQFKVTSWHCTLTLPQWKSLPSLTFLYLTLSETEPRQDFRTRGHNSKSKVYSRSHQNIAHLHPPLTSPLSFNFLYITTSENYSPDKIFENKVTSRSSKVTLRSHHDAAHLHPLTNVSTKCQFPTPYSFQNIVWTRF